MSARRSPKPRTAAARIARQNAVSAEEIGQIGVGQQVPKPDHHKVA